MRFFHALFLALAASVALLSGCVNTPVDTVKATPAEINAAVDKLPGYYNDSIILSQIKTSSKALSSKALSAKDIDLSGGDSAKVAMLNSVLNNGSLLLICESTEDSTYYYSAKSFAEFDAGCTADFSGTVNTWKFTFNIAGADGRVTGISAGNNTIGLKPAVLNWDCTRPFQPDEGDLRFGSDSLVKLLMTKQYGYTGKYGDVIALMGVYMSSVSGNLEPFTEYYYVNSDGSIRSIMNPLTQEEESTELALTSS